MRAQIAPALVVTGEERVFAVQGHRPFILPMSAKIGRFIILGIPILADASMFGG